VTGREPDVEIAAIVRADELRFECKPEVVVREVAVAWRVAARLSDPDF
jgi:hypothetical protein